MWKDPIVEEIRETRKKLAAEAGNDLAEICRRLRRSERERKAGKQGAVAEKWKSAKALSKSGRKP